jgi:hypothetical protein
VNAETLRVLLLEDSPADAELVQQELRRAAIVAVPERADTEQAFTGALRDFAPQLILGMRDLAGLVRYAVRRERVERIIAQGLDERRTVEYEWRVVRPSGEVRHIHGSNVVIVDAAGTPLGLAGTSLDITERKVAEQSQQTLLHELQVALAEVRPLQGMIRICASCKRVLNDEGSWEQFESYVRGHSEVEFSHGICPDCARQWSEPDKT